MDVKDINNASILSVLGRNSASAVNNAFIGDAFSSLLESNPHTAELADAGTKFAVKDNKPVDVKSVQTSRETPQKEKIADKPRNEPVKAEDKSVREDNDVQSQGNKRDKVTDKTAEKAGEAENKDLNAEEENTAPKSPADMAIVMVAAGLGLASAEPIETTVPAGVSENTAAVSPAVVADPSEVVKPVDALVQAASTNKTGIDISEMTAVDDVEAAAVLNTIAPEVSEIVETAVAPGAKAEKGQGKDKTAASAGTAEVTEVLLDAEASQVAETQKNGIKYNSLKDIDLNLDADVEVVSDQEKFAYRSSGDLLANAKDVNDAVEMVVSKTTEGKSADAKNSKILSSAPVTDVSNRNAPVSGVVNTAQTIADTSAMVKNNIEAPSGSAARGDVSEIKSVNLAQAASGSEFVNAAKLNAAEAKTQVNDAYKGMSREVAEQVKVNITKSAVKGVDKIDISLKPEDLGHIEIKMQISKNGKLQAEIIASRPETAEMLQKEAQSLQKAFNEAGFQTDDNSLNFSYRGDSQANQNQQQERSPEMRKFMGELLDNDFSNDNASAYEQAWNAQSGLNIKV